MDKINALDIAHHAKECDMRDLIAARASLERFKAADAQEGFRLIEAEINQRMDKPG